MTKIKLLKTVMVEGKGIVDAGKTIEVEDYIARTLLGIKCAEFANKQEKENLYKEEHKEASRILAEEERKSSVESQPVIKYKSEEDSNKDSKAITTESNPELVADKDSKAVKNKKGK